MVNTGIKSALAELGRTTGGLASSQSPLCLFRLRRKCARSLAPPFPTQPTALGLCGGIFIEKKYGLMAAMLGIKIAALLGGNLVNTGIKSALAELGRTTGGLQTVLKPSMCRFSLVFRGFPGLPPSVVLFLSPQNRLPFNREAPAVKPHSLRRKAPLAYYTSPWRKYP